MPPVEVVTSAQAHVRHDIALESWGQRGWDLVGSLCVWARERGMKDAPCK